MWLQAAQQSNPSYVVPIVTVVVSGFVALVVGFGAAILKHRWDVEDDKRARQREREERRRDELRTAFQLYLSARAETEAIIMLLQPNADQTTVAGFAAAFQAAVNQTVQLGVMLDDDDAAIVKADCTALHSWTIGMLKRLRSNESEMLAAPRDVEIRHLIRRLLDS